MPSASRRKVHLNANLRKTCPMTMGRASQFKVIGRPDLSTFPTPTRLPPANHGFTMSGTSASTKIWRNSRKTCKTPESKDCPTTPFKKSARRPSGPVLDPIGKDCRDLNTNSRGSAGAGGCDCMGRGAISSGLGGNLARSFYLITSLASANPGDTRRLAACPGRPKDTNRQTSASRCSALLSIDPFRPRLRTAMTASSHRPCRSPIFQRASKLLVKAMAWPRRCPRLFCLQTDLGNMSSSVQALRARCFAAISLGMSRSTAAGASSQASRRLEETTAASNLAYSLRI